MNRRRRIGGWVLAPTAIVALASLFVSNAGAADPVPGSQGIDTSLPPTGSQVTVGGRGDFADLEITVNQTANLTNQAVSITWEGGVPTVSGPGRFAANYLQIFQCWGDDDGTIPENPGPPPEQCVQGAVAGTYGGLPGGLYPPGFSVSRIISRSDWANFDPEVGVLDTRTTNVWRPFRAVDGTVVDIQIDPNFAPGNPAASFWLNPYFGIVTTNEIAAANTGRDGSGAELMQVATGVQSSGLGCGQRVQEVPGGGVKTPQCWIVVVPRGNPVVENAGTPFEVDADQRGVVTSPLAPAAWQNRIAIPIDFNSVDSPCALGQDERRISGNELALSAVASWQPALCLGTQLPPFSYAQSGDAQARQQLSTGGIGSPGMVVVSSPLAPTVADETNPVVYAPLTVSGLVVGVNVERNPRPTAPEAALELAGVRVAELNLTPRLVAKLLTQSYVGQLSINGNPPDYAWLETNPQHLGLDPDFLQFNPEFGLLQIASSRNFGGLSLPSGNSDAARQVWSWVLADPEARAWLDGAPDPWGMQVNPVYATLAANNLTGQAFADPVPSSFPKAEPYCYKAPPRGPNDSITPPPLCGTDWMPYSRGFADSAQITRAASDGARTIDNAFAVSAAEVWQRELPQYLGRRSMLSITDTPSAAQFGLQVARLSRAGDNGPDRSFIAPDTAGLLAGVRSMVPGAVEGFLEPAPSSNAPDAYPLTSMTYAAIKPLALGAEARQDYASFLDYAAGDGQESGTELGQLPAGYAPMPFDLRIQAAFGALLVRSLVATPAPPSAPPTTETTTSTTAAPTTTTAPPTENVQVSGAPFPSQANQGGSASRSSTGARSSPAPATSAGVAPEAPVSTEPSSPTTTVDVLAEETDAAVSEPETPALITPFLALGRSRYAVPGIGVVALASMLGALEITKRPRRKVVGSESIAGTESLDAALDPG